MPPVRALPAGALLSMADLAVIMGATGGLGSAIVDAFAKRGDRVIAVARSRSDVSQLASKYPGETDRKSTRLNSSHDQISYAVFCLKKKTSAGTGSSPA